MAQSDSVHDRYAAFKSRSYTLYWLSRFCVTFASLIISVAVGWQVYDLTREPFYLGLVGLSQFLPALLLVLVTGATADKFSRRLIMFFTDIIEVLCAAALLYLTITNNQNVWLFFPVLAVFGTARAFSAPATAALITNVVPEKDFANAVAWNSSAWQAATIIGPMAGGLLYGVSAEIAYSSALVLLLLAAFLIMIIPKPNQKADMEQVNLKSLLAGFKFIYKEKIIFGAISLDLFAVLMGGAVALLPVFARDILELGPWGLGLLRAGPGIGAVIVAIWLSGKPINHHAGLIMFVCVGLFGFFTIVFGASTIVWVSVLSLALLGAADMVSVYIRETLIQLRTPDPLRGRVNAVNMVFVGASNELGEFRAGTMAAVIGTIPAVIFGGVGAIGIAFIWAYMFPQLRKAQHLERDE